MKVFYARVSTEEQNEARQIAKANELGIEKRFVDKASGKNTDRPEFKKMMEFVREGDVVVVESFSRLARNTKDLLTIIEELKSRGVSFVSIKESVDTETAQGKFMLTVFGAMYEMERENILDRQREGIAIAKAEDAERKAQGLEPENYKGRRRIDPDEKQMKLVCKAWRSGQITATAAMKQLNMKPNTFYRRVKEMGL